MERAELARLLGGRSAPADAGAPRLVEERDPERFLPAFAAAAAGEGAVFLADPDWGAEEKAALRETIAAGGAAEAQRGWLMLPSGGTSGKLKFARHDQDSLAAAVEGFRARFQARRINGVGVLPLHHVGGLMAWMRSALTGGVFLPWNWKRLEAGELPSIPRGGKWFLSLVPTQLQRLLPRPATVDWLRRFEAVFVGGGPAWDGLTEAAAQARLRISLGYGATETAAMVATQRPEDFLAGDRSCGSPLPHVRLGLAEDGTVRVEGDAVFRGYFPGWSSARQFWSDDLGRIDERGRLHILGRRDEMIVTGGKKVDPLEVEAALRASGEFEDVAVIGQPDPEWGERVTACYPSGGRPPDLARAAAAAARLAAHKRPRRYLALAAWPRNAQGKLNRAALRAAATASDRG